MVLSLQKKITSVAALSLSAVLLFGSTFAWQSLNQEALNYVRGGANPGGRLHDDFHNITAETDPETLQPYATKTFDKDVYVENFTSAADDGVNIYARVRLDEYLEWGTNAGTGSGSTTSLVEGATFEKKSSWTTYIPDAEEAVKEGNATPAQENSAKFRKYWELTWEKGGSTVYMPTFNKNKDSLLADINGTFEGGYVKYALEEAEGVLTQKSGYVVQDKDENDIDELTDQTELADLIQKGVESSYYNTYAENITVSSATHTATTSLTAGNSMSMADWLAAAERAEEPSDLPLCWVYDTDGWFYWSAPIEPGTATGKLLDQIQRTGMGIGNEGDTWYYGLNVVAQFITSDSLGSQADNEDMGSGFYEKDKGEPPTKNALLLLKTIGVDTDGTGSAALAMLETETVEVSDEYGLRQAIGDGRDVILTEDIELAAPVVVEESTCVYLNGCALTPSADFSGRALFIVSNGAWLDVDERGLMQGPADGYTVWVEEDSYLYIWDGTFVGGTGAVYVDSGEAVIVDGTFYLQGGDAGELLDRSGDGEILVYCGTFYGFDPSNAHGVNLLEQGYTVEVDHYDGETVYTAVLDALSDLPAEELPSPPDPVWGEDEAEDDVWSGDVPTEESPAGPDADDGRSDEDQRENSDTSVSVPETPLTVPDSSESANTGSGSVSGISGKADAVEPALPSEEDGAETGTADGDGAGEDTAQST